MSLPDAPTQLPDDTLGELGAIGPYRLIRPLGQGGMGVVYLAVRGDDEFKKRVAIKVLRRGMDSESIIRRFRHERQILASLQHPHIATLLDGGTTPDGAPYFAMEYVEGEVVTEYCQRHRLDVTARLELFRKICAAVHHAHQNLVIHRDIKPANVIVTGDGTPKLLDFGIAKLVNPELGGHTVALTVDGLLMTPEYASPEQVRGENVTTATDIYSLGVLLYEMLTNRRPYKLTSNAPADVARVVCDSAPIRPSTAVTQLADGDETRSAERAGEARLSRLLRGDLDNIVLKALSKEPERRYASVDQFSEDLHRYLSGRPVIARKDTVRYRMSKFVRRNRAAVVFASVTVVALAAGVVVSTMQARIAARERQRAEQRFEEVRGLANSLLFEVHDAIRDLPGATPTRQLLVNRALEYLDRLAADAGERPDLQRDIASAYLRVGDVQGRPLNPNLGDTQGARASYDKAVGIYESLARLGEPDVALRRDLGTAYLRVSALASYTGDTATALTLAERALGLYEGVPELRRDLAVAHSSVGDLRSATMDTARALEHRRTSLALMQALAEADPSDSNNLRQLGVAYQKLGNSLGNPNYPNVGDYRGALENLERSRDVLRKAASLYPTSGVFKRNLAVIQSNLSDVLIALKRHDQAIASQREALAMFQVLADADAADVAAKNDVAISTFKVAELLENAGKLPEAIVQYEAALDIHERLAAADPQNSEFQAQIASDVSGLGRAQGKQGDSARALTSHARAVAISRELSSADPANVEARLAVALALVDRAQTLERLRQPADAVGDYEEAVAIMQALQQQGAIEGTDAQTLADAQAALARLRQGGTRLSR